MPYYIKDPKRDPNIDNHPYEPSSNKAWDGRTELRVDHLRHFLYSHSFQGNGFRFRVGGHTFRVDDFRVSDNRGP